MRQAAKLTSQSGEAVGNKRRAQQLLDRIKDRPKWAEREAIEGGKRETIGGRPAIFALPTCF